MLPGFLGGRIYLVLKCCGAAVGRGKRLEVEVKISHVKIQISN
jgi:hypothetical protein